MTDGHAEYANDLKLKPRVSINLSVEKFLELLIQHVPDRYAHNIRYFGLASPGGKRLSSSARVCSSRKGTKATAQAPFIRGNER